HLSPELRATAAHLVAEDPAVLGQPQRRVAAPEVQAGAAPVGERDLDEDGVGLDLGPRQLADLEGLARPDEDGGSTGGRRETVLSICRRGGFAGLRRPT